MKMNQFYHEKCFETMDKMIAQEFKVDNILTSPFYNSNKKQGSSTTRIKNNGNHIRYDQHVDDMTTSEYIDFTVELFNKYDQILKENGTVIYNINYGANNTEDMFRAINEILVDTPFTIADVIIWKKKSAMPVNVSKNKLTRIYEFVFIFCREAEIKSFHFNREVTSVRSNGQKMYENIFNILPAKNNDEVNPYNKATFSSELVEKLLKMYGVAGGVVYDSFMGTGTTAVGAYRLGINYIGSEISLNQVNWSKERIKKEQLEIDLFKGVN